MAHWAEVDENNKVIRVLVGSNDDPDEGHQWLVDNLGGRWLKTSYNTRKGVHLQGGTPYRGNYAAEGFEYYEDIDAFMPPKPFPSWHIDAVAFEWRAPTPRPQEGDWRWDEDNQVWVEVV